MEKTTLNDLITRLEEITDFASDEFLLPMKMCLAAAEWKIEKNPPNDQREEFDSYVKTFKEFGYKFDQVDNLTAIVDIVENSFIIPYLEYPRTMALVGFMAESLSHVEPRPSKYQFDDLIQAHVGLFRRMEIF